MGFKPKHHVCEVVFKSIKLMHLVIILVMVITISYLLANQIATGQNEIASKSKGTACFLDTCFLVEDSN